LHPNVQRNHGWAPSGDHPYAVRAVDRQRPRAVGCVRSDRVHGRLVTRAEGGVVRHRAAPVISVLIALGSTSCGSGGGGAAAGSSPSPGTTHSASCAAQSGVTGKVADHGTMEASGSTTKL